MSVDRREFLKAGALSGLGLLAGSAALGAGRADAAANDGKKEYVDRIAFDVWLNDVRLESSPLENWPSGVFDDVTVESILRALDVQAESGYNIVDLAGFFATYSLPVDIRSAVDPDRRRRIDRIVRAAHARGVKLIIFPSGVYSWGFDEIIRQNPVLKGSNRHAMCASREESFE